MPFDDDAIPCRRPHFHLRDGKLYFLISSRAHTEMDGPGISLWGKLDGRATIGDLRSLYPDLDDRLRALWAGGVIEIVSAVPVDRRRILIVEPHMDDAVLSVGGVMWQRRQECEFTVLSVVGTSNFTSYHRLEREYFDVSTVTALRREESALAMRMVGGHHRTLGVLDAPLRYESGSWTLAWFTKHRRAIAAFINRAPDVADVEALALQLKEEMQSPAWQEVWIPMGIGTSTDHESTRNACLLALASGDVLERCHVYLYQDVPYAHQFPRHARQIVDALTSAGGRLDEIRDDVDDAMAAKFRMLEVFGSQFKPSYMVPRVTAAAGLAAGAPSRRSEIRYRLMRLPANVDTSTLYSGRDSIRAIADRLVAWYPAHRDAKRIRILCPVGVGRWRTDLSALLKAFPHATFDVHMAGDAIEETTTLESPRIRVLPVQGTTVAWLRRILKVLLSRPHPLIVVTSWRGARVLPLVRYVTWWTSPLPVTTMCHLVEALGTTSSTAHVPARSEGVNP